MAASLDIVAAGGDNVHATFVNVEVVKFATGLPFHY